MDTLSDLKPRSKRRMFDLAEEAGFDVTDWRNSSNDARGPKANPKYCYEWAYVEPGKLIILNLWYPKMIEEDGRIIQRANFRSDVEIYRTANRKVEWVKRAQRLDNAVQAALRDNLPVRVVLVDGAMRDKDDTNAKPSSVKFRELDPEPWTITEYDWDTGALEIARGIITTRFVDQFDLDQAAKSRPERRDANGTVVVRDPAVRRRVLHRAAGLCELCGQQGFRMHNGALYLETHHVIPLGEDGADDDQNVVALCAHDHRRAHFAENRDVLRERLLVRLGRSTAAVDG